MPRDPRVIDLLLRYEELQEQGEPVTPETLCRDAPELLDELRRGIADLQAARQRLATPPHDGEQSTVLAESPEDVRLPERAGRYEIEGEIARGGMGAVWRARDTQLNRALAIKVLRLDRRGRPEAEQRFLEEAQITGQLQHPGIPPVHELGTLADGRPFFAMKLIKGRTLADLLRDRPTPQHDLPRFLTIFEYVCQAVAYAHSKRVIHRDLKPLNIMVGAFGEVQVMDWGLAKVLTGGPPAAAAGSPGTFIATVRTGSPGLSSQAGAVLGTYAYMAPEQAQGEVAILDERTDVFGLGAMLCEVLTGQPPYSGKSVAVLALSADLGPAQERLAGCGADAELVGLARQCLAADPAERPRDAGAVAMLMAKYLTGVQERLREAELGRAAAQARAQEAKATADAARQARRRTRALAAAVLALVAVAAAGGLLLQRQARRDGEQRLAVESALAKTAALREQARWREAAAVLEQARRGLGDAGPTDLRQLLDAADAELALVNRLDAIRQRRATLIDGKFDDRTAARDYALVFRDAGLGEVGDDSEAVAARVRASGASGPLVLALDDWAAVAEDPELKAWLLGVARLADPDPWRDRFREPAVWRDRAALQALVDAALGDPEHSLAGLSPQMLAALGRLLQSLGCDAVPLLREAQRRHEDDFWLALALGNALHEAKRVDEAVGSYSVAVALRPDSSAAHHNLGVVLYDKKDLDGAIAAYRKAISLDPKNAAAHHNLGVNLFEKNDLDGAIAEFREALALNPRHPNARVCIGNALHDKHDLPGAVAEYEEAIKIDASNANAHYSLGNALHDRNDLPGAIAEYRQAITLDPGHPQAHYNLGLALYDRKDLDGAIREFRSAIAIEPDRALAHYNLGIALREKPDLAGATAALRKSADLGPKLAQAHGALATTLLRQGRFAEARTAIQRCLELLPERDPRRQFVTQQLEQCERQAALDVKLSAVLGGSAEPADAAEQLALAQLCRWYKQRHATAARFYAAAFAADPRLAADLRQQHRYNAACSAALAAAGQGEDVTPLLDKVQVRLRRQALGWLRDDLAAYAKLAEGDNAKARERVRQNLARWRQDADLASVRDAALARLPEDEGGEWRRLWQDAEALLKMVADKP